MKADFDDLLISITMLAGVSLGVSGFRLKAKAPEATKVSGAFF